MDLRRYRESELEKARTQDLLRILPRGRRTVLEIGARDGHFSRLLTDYFESVTAIDLEVPQFHLDRVKTAHGDVTQLQFADDSFDCIFCAEVLEHVPALEKACSEMARVARHEIVVGVPYRQDTRVRRTTCLACGKVNPPWGHINTFDEQRLIKLFHPLRLAHSSFVCQIRDRTNWLSTWLMDLGGNPWGAYEQEEPCVGCGARLSAPALLSLPQKTFSNAARLLNTLQRPFVRSMPIWIHAVFCKPATWVDRL